MAYTLDDYQSDALITKGTNEDRFQELAILALGIAGEAGEVADYVKKVLGHGHPMDAEKLKKEIGDVLWYAATLSAHFGFSLGDVGKANIDKLKTRYAGKFSTAASLARVDVKDGDK